MSIMGALALVGGFVLVAVIIVVVVVAVTVSGAYSATRDDEDI